MPDNKTKTCPRCNTGFECKAGDVANCQCAPVQLNQSQRDYISQQYDDCLCANCLEQLREIAHDS